MYIDEHLQKFLFQISLFSVAILVIKWIDKAWEGTPSVQIKQSFLCFLKYREISGLDLVEDFFFFLERKLILLVRTDYSTLKYLNLAISNLYIRKFEYGNFLFEDRLFYAQQKFEVGRLYLVNSRV